MKHFGVGPGVADTRRRCRIVEEVPQQLEGFFMQMRT
jgi:hypothetical protein